MDLNDIPDVKSWLDQFDLPDRYVAEHMLRRIRYVSFEEVERWLQSSVNCLLEEIRQISGKSAVAIIPVSKPFIHSFNKDKEPKSPNDSSGRIAHSLKNLQRNLPEYVELSPRLESMRERKVRNIIFVDDFVGTGNRFSKFWKEMVSPSVKSWSSRGWCKIWVLTFAAHRSGIRRIFRNNKHVSSHRFRSEIEIDESIFLSSESMRAVLGKYGQALGASSQVMGYGGLASPIVFQYGCPNNVPLIFWCRPSQARRDSWRPIFYNRNVSEGVYALFSGEVARDALPEELWMAGHYSLALNVLERLVDFGTSHQWLLVLGLLEKRKKIEKIRSVMILSDAAFAELLESLKSGGLVDESFGITRFGRDVLARAAKPAKVGKTILADSNFYPSSFLGFQREA